MSGPATRSPDVMEVWREAHQAYVETNVLVGRNEAASNVITEAKARWEREALERAAQVAERWIEPIMATAHENRTYTSVAATIRALKDRQP